MKKINLITLAFIALLVSSTGWAAKSCEELKGEIEANISNNGVQGYNLVVLSNNEAEAELNDNADAKIVGSCEGGTQKIVYWRSDKPIALFNDKSQASRTTSLAILLAQ